MPNGAVPTATVRRRMVTALSRRMVFRAALAVALAATACLVAPVAVPALLPAASAAQPVSGAFALGGGVGGSVDPRSGQFSVSVPLVSVASRGDSSVSLTLGWDQARAGIGLDRFGFGGGWSLGTTFIETVGQVTVYPANGGAYTTDDTFASGLHNYPLEDLEFADAAGTLPDRAGVSDPVDYSYTVSYDDGRVDYFDADGNLVARSDRFGNRTDLQYEQIGSDQWQPTKVIDAYGLTTTFTYGADSFTVAAPKRSDGVEATTVVQFDNDNRVQSVTDPGGSVANFQYAPVSGSPYDYLDTVSGPAGAQTIVTYAEVDYPQADPLFVAETLQITDADGKELVPTRQFSMDPPGNVGQHNYAGYPTYLSSSEDALYDSGDPGYQYMTEISTDQASTISTYDSAHRLIARDITTSPDSAATVVVQQQDMTYPDFAAPQAQPANYARPLTSTVTFLASSGPGGVTATSGSGRVVKTSTTYNDHGRVLTSVDETGTKTTTTYDPTYGLVTSTVATGTDGTTRSVTNALSADKKTITSTTQAETSSSGKLSARNLVSYRYDEYGQPTQRTISWAAGAAPPDNGGGPESSTTKLVSTVDPDAVTRTIEVTIAAGTPAAATTTTVLDLVTGQPVKITDPVGRVTTNSYDPAGRIAEVTPPTGLTTTTSYQPAIDDAPATQLVTGPDGHQTQTTYDPLGRAVRVTDNVKDGEFVDDPTARTVSTHAYNADGTTLTATDLAGRTTTTTVDPLGRPVSETSATGVTKTSVYDDVANTITRQTIPDGTTTAAQIVRTGYDDRNREIASRTTYPVPGKGRPLFVIDPAERTVYDGIGRIASVTSGDLIAKPDFAGPGGVPVTTTVASAPTARVQSPAITTSATTAIDSRPTLRTLQQNGQPARSGTKITYNAAGQITSTTDPLGRTTTYTYTPDGRPATRTTPTGTVTTNTYDEETGQLTSVTSTAADGTTTTTSYTYVPAGSRGAGLVETLTNESGTLTYGYDADGNRRSISYPDGSRITNTYADTGLLQTSTDITGAITSYEYNPDSTLKSAIQVRDGVTLASVNYTYDGLGRLATVTRDSGLTTTNTYTPNNLLATQVTKDGTGDQVEAHSYVYDDHHNLTSKTDVTAEPSSCGKVCRSSPSTFGTWTTTYAYDAYDRLVGSAVYAGRNAAGKPITAISYALDTSGNVTTTTRTTRTTGFKPTTTTSVTTDTIDAAGQLKQRAVGSTTTSQSYDADGRVINSLGGASTTYRPDGLPASVTDDGVTTTFAYWADGTRRRSTTVDPATGTTSVEFHYSPIGTLANDTTTQPSGSATASYLLTTGREARTLLPNTTPAGAPTNAAAPVTTGTGVGYYLRDRHSSVTAMVDSSGAVTNTYAYGDYGTPALLDGRPGTVLGADAGTGAGQDNPLRYTGAALKALYSDTALDTMMTPARFYDPSQGRFTAHDVANVHNGYVGFDTNPIMKVDPTGQSPLADFIIDALYVVTFVVATALTGGAALAAGAAVFGAEAAVEVTAASVAAFAAQAVATAANAVGFAANAVRLGDDISSTSGNGHFLSDDWRNDLTNIATVAGTIAGVAGLGASVAEASTAEAAEAAHGAGNAPPDVAQPEAEPLAANDPAPNNPVNAAPDDPVEVNDADNEPVGVDDVQEPAGLDDPPANENADQPPAQPLALDDAVDPAADHNPMQAADLGQGLNVEPPQVANPDVPVALPVVNNLNGVADHVIAGDDAGAHALNEAVEPPPAHPNVVTPLDLTHSSALSLTNAQEPGRDPLDLIQDDLI